VISVILIAMLALIAAPILLAVAASGDDRSEALALIERLGGRYHVDPDKPGKPAVSVSTNLQLIFH
jgi:hypothetical protein